MAEDNHIMLTKWRPHKVEISNRPGSSKLLASHRPVIPTRPMLPARLALAMTMRKATEAVFVEEAKNTVSKLMASYIPAMAWVK